MRLVLRRAFARLRGCGRAGGYVAFVPSPMYGLDLGDEGGGMDGPPRMTYNMLRILMVLLEDPTTERYGLEVGQAAGLRGGSLYPVFGRLEDAGLLVSRWEETDPSEAGRPRRRLYRLTPGGLEYA